MNNNQFRKLLFNKPEGNNQDGSQGAAGASGKAGATLGGKKSSFMPMTPRTVKGGIDVDFARQVRERNAASKPAKKFNSYVPKGVKYGSGYTDRAKAREEDAKADDDKAERIKALEEQMKLGQIEPEMFAALRDQITGGDISNTHLVKGLDRQLLERVRRGDDVLRSEGGDATENKESTTDLDDELDKVAEKEVETIKRDKVEKKKGTMAPPPVAGVKRSRDEILAELKAQRKAAAEAKTASLMNGRWKKVGEKQKSRIEIDHKGREVMITVDEDGVVKKKVRKIPAKDPNVEQEPSMDMPDESKPILGADTIVPEQIIVPEQTEEDDGDDDIFAGVGTEYNPLGDEDEDEDEDDSDDDSDDDAPVKKSPKLDDSANTELSDTETADKTAESDAAPAQQAKPDVAPTEQAKPAAAPRNYFNDNATVSENKGGDRFAGIESILKKAARLDPLGSANAEDGDGDPDQEAREARRKKHAQMVAQQDRDLEDMDMGFGSSRYEDEADGDGEAPKLRLSEWKGDAGGDEAGGDQDGKGDGKGDGKKKRKPKKRKGDVNNAADIMRVIERRRTAEGK